MLSISTSGSWDRSENILKRILDLDIISILRRYGELGVNALSNATPMDTGRTAGSWYYEIEYSKGSQAIVFKNSHIVDGNPIAILLQYGHGTGTGGYVAGRDYINPAIQPIFDKLANDVWKEVNR